MLTHFSGLDYFPRFAAIILSDSPDGFALSASVLRRSPLALLFPNQIILRQLQQEAARPGRTSSPY